MNNIVIRNIEPQEIRISGGGEVLGIQKVYVNGVDVTIGSAAYVIVPTKTSELINDSGFITSESDPTVPSYVKAISLADINNWNNKQNQLVSGTNIKTINGDSILGAGNLTIDTTYSAGTGIEITEENVINNTITSYDDLTDLPTIPDKTSDLLNDSGYVVDTELAEVAFNGSYLALSNTPTIPDSTSQLVNDSGYIDMDLLWSLFPKSTGSGSSINLTDTVKNAPLYLTLGATALSQDGTPTPSSPQDIHTISGNNTLVVCGKNLIGLGTQLNGYVDADTLKFENTLPSAQNSVGYYFKTSTLPNTITFSNVGGNRANVCYFNEIPNDEVACVLRDASNSNPRTITVNKAYPYVHLQLSYNNTIVSNIQVEVGSTATTYTPYTSQEADIDLDTLEYCKIGTYADRIFKNVSSDPDYDSEKVDGAWYIKKNIGKIVLDGTEGWGAAGEGDTTNGYSIYSDNLPNIVSSSTKVVKSDKFNGLLRTEVTSSSINFIAGIWTKTVVLNIDRTLLSEESVAGFRNWLSTNQPIVYYQLATPTYTQITGTLAEELETIYKDLTSESEQTNISQVNADLPFTITATTLKSLTNL